MPNLQLNIIGIQPTLLVACGIYFLWIVWLISLGLYADYLANRGRLQGARLMAHRLQTSLILLLVSMLGSTGCIALGFMLHRDQARALSPLGNIYGLSALGGLTLAGMFFTWWFIGDRAYGRERCPRCLYDMSRRNSLVCPECGRDARQEERLSFTRRRRLVFILAILLALPSSYLFIMSHRMKQYGVTALIPGQALMLGWDVLPEHWILDSNVASFMNESTLEHRISRRRISNDATIAFARKLLKPIGEDQEARWDKRRINLLQVSQQHLAYTLYGGELKAVINWYPTNQDLDSLFNTTLDDMLESAIAVEHDRADMFHLKVIDGIWHYNPTWMIADWIAYKAIDEGRMTVDELETTLKLTELTSAALSPRIGLLEDAEFQRCMMSEDDSVSMVVFCQMSYRGRIDDMFEEYIQLIEQSDKPISPIVGYRLPEWIRSAQEITKHDFTDHLLRWAISGNTHQRDFAVSFCARQEMLTVFDRNNPDSMLPSESYDQAVEQLHELLESQSVEITPDFFSFAAYSDSSGKYFLPLIAQLINEDQTDLILSSRLWISKIKRDFDSDLWAKHLLPIIGDAKPDIQLWLLNMLPRHISDSSKSQIIEELLLLKQSENIDISDHASSALRRLGNSG